MVCCWLLNCSYYLPDDDAIHKAHVAITAGQTQHWSPVGRLARSAQVKELVSLTVCAPEESRRQRGGNISSSNSVNYSALSLLVLGAAAIARGGRRAVLCCRAAINNISSSPPYALVFLFIGPFSVVLGPFVVVVRLQNAPLAGISGAHLPIHM